MTLFVVYRIEGKPRVKEFNDVVKAVSFAEWADGKVYYEKEGVKYPDEDKEKDRHLLAQMNGHMCKRNEPLCTHIISRSSKKDKREETK